MGRIERCGWRQDEQEKSKVKIPRCDIGTWGTRHLNFGLSLDNGRSSPTPVKSKSLPSGKQPRTGSARSRDREPASPRNQSVMQARERRSTFEQATLPQYRAQRTL